MQAFGRSFGLLASLCLFGAVCVSGQTPTAAPSPAAVTTPAPAPSPTAAPASSPSASPAPAAPETPRPTPVPERELPGGIREGSVVVIPVKGEINKALHIFLRRNLKLAERIGAKAVILEMDTYGGDLSAATKMQEALLATKLPTYTFINANAGSAGAMISLATNHIWMAPLSAIGAAAPVQGGGQDLEKTMQDKVVSYFSAKARAVAEARGHNPDIAEAFMNKEKEVKIGDEIVSPKGKLLTFDAKAASRVINGKPVLAAGVAANLSDLAAKAKLDGELRRVEMSGFERLGLAIAGLAPLFLLGGIVCAYLEFKLPGATIPGFLAAIFFGLFFFGHYVVGLAGFEVVALFILGVLLLVLEFMFFPGLVLPAVIGVALMVGSLLLAMADRYPSQPFIPSLDQLTMPLINLALAIAFAAVVISILVTMLPKTTLYSRLVLAETIHGGSGEPEPGAAPVAVGATGTTRTALRPAGKAELAGRTVDVVSEGGFVEPGTAVKVVKVEGATVVVSAVV